MATYSTIKGFNIQSLASDPLTTVVAGGTWASSNTVNTGRSAMASAGTQTAAFIAGGGAAPTRICY